MKNLVKKLLFPLIVSSAMFFLPFSGFAKGKQIEKSKSNFYIGGGVGVYHGAEDMRKVYGNNMLKLRGNAGLNFKNFRLESSLIYVTKEKGPGVYNIYGEDMEVKSKINIVGLEPLVHYLLPVYWPIFYLGGGLTFMNATEKVSFSPLYRDAPRTLEVSVKAVGPIFAFGVDIPINREKTRDIYVEFSKRSAKLKWIFGEIIDIGGSSLDAGMRFSF